MDFRRSFLFRESQQVRVGGDDCHIGKTAVSISIPVLWHWGKGGGEGCQGQGGGEEVCKLIAQAGGWRHWVVVTFWNRA